jgi:hypothetical protein
VPAAKALALFCVVAVNALCELCITRKLLTVRAAARALPRRIHAVIELLDDIMTSNLLKAFRSALAFEGFDRTDALRMANL